jgi:uncharacterized protein DUF5667/putative zinc finger protein
MLSHATTRDWLIPYADGMLAADERRRLDGHLTGCASCAADLREVRELNLLLVSLPPAPPVAFAPFWLKLQAVLPQRRTLRIPSLVRYRRLGVAFALAAMLALAVTGTALAAPSAMPDSPLYPVKQLEEGLQLSTAPASGRLSVELAQANERLREAQVMAADHKPLLAVDSLRVFRVTLNEAAASLAKPVDPQRAQQELRRLRAGLDAVERQNAAKDDDDSVVRQLVVDAAADLDRIEHRDAATPASTLIIGSEATPDPAPAPQPQPAIEPTSTPRQSDEEQGR